MGMGLGRGWREASEGLGGLDQTEQEDRPTPLQAQTGPFKRVNMKTDSGRQFGHLHWADWLA